MTNTNTQTLNPSSVRAAIASAIDSRIAFEEKTQGGDKTKKQLLNMMKEADNLSPLPLAYSERNSFNWDNFINSHKVSTARCNIYAIPKVWTLMEAIETKRFVRLFDSDPATLSTTILALGEGIQNEKTIAERVNVLMTGLRRWQAFNECVSRGPANVLRMYELNKKSVYTYGSGPTQAGSSLRALEGMGLVQNVGKEGNCKLWRFTSLNEETRDMIRIAWEAIACRMYETPDKSPMGPRSYPKVPETPFLIAGTYEGKKTDEETASAANAAPVAPVIEILPSQDSLDLLDMVATEQEKVKTTPKTEAKKTTPRKATSKVEKPKSGETVSLAELAKTKKETVKKTATPRKATSKKTVTK